MEQAIIFCKCGFFFLILLSRFLSSFFFAYSQRSQIGLDVYHTSTHDVALVRIWNAGLKCAARGSLKIQDAKIRPKFAICVPSHNFVWLYLRKW